MFAVMGITGNVGGKVADTLLQRGKQVRGVVRDRAKAAAWKEKGVELITADYDDKLTAAFTGVEGVFAMIPPNMLPDPGFPDSVARIAAIRKAILTARPPRAVFLSSIGSENPPASALSPLHTSSSRNSTTLGYLVLFCAPGHSWRTSFTAFLPLAPPASTSPSISLLTTRSR